MSFEKTVGDFAASLDDPSVAPSATTLGRVGAPDARRFSVYRNNVAVGLIGALEARYPVSRRIAGEDLFRAMARAFMRAHKPRSPVMIAYGGEFPAFMADYLAAAEAGPDLRGTALEFTRGHSQRVSSPLVGEDQGGGSRRPARLARGNAFANLLGSRDPPPLPAPTRGGGAANGADPVQQALDCLVDVARLENAWVEAYHAEDAVAATVAELAALSADCLPYTRVAFHPAARLMRFATPDISIWAAAQSANSPPASTEGSGEDALVTRSDCEVRVRVLPPLGYDFAVRLREGATLIEAAAA